MVNVEKLLKSLSSGLYEWDAETLTLCRASISAKISARQRVFCILDESHKQPETLLHWDGKETIMTDKAVYQAQKSDYEKTDEQGRPLTYWGGLKDTSTQHAFDPAKRFQDYKKFGAAVIPTPAGFRTQNPVTDVSHAHCYKHFPEMNYDCGVCQAYPAKASEEK